MTTKQLLIEEFGPVGFQLMESADGRLVAEGEFGYCDRPTSNGRVYPRKIMEREFERLRPKMEQGGLFGELDHPEDGKTKLQRAALIIESMNIAPDGRVTGRFRVMEGTPNGDTLAAIVRAGGKVGVSSRGIGSTVTEGASLVVQDDFRLFGYDAVAEPAVSSALPEFNEEGRRRGGRGMREEREMPSASRSTRAPIASASQARYLSDDEVSELIESDKAGVTPGDLLQLVESITRDGGASSRRIQQELESARAELAAKDLLLQRAGIALEQEHHEREEIEEELELAEQQLDQLMQEQDLLKNTLWSFTADTLINNALPLVHTESREHFLRLIGKPAPGSSLGELKSRVEVHLDEFERTGRAARLDVDLFLERTELLDEAKQALINLAHEANRSNASDALLAESAQELSRLSGEVVAMNELRAKLGEAASALTRIGRENKQLHERAVIAEEQYVALEEHVQELERQVNAASRFKTQLEAVKLDNMKLKRCLSAQHPKRMYEALATADSKEMITEQAERFMRSSRASDAHREVDARPTQFAGTGSSQHMPITEEAAVLRSIKALSEHRGKNIDGTSAFVESAPTHSIQQPQQPGAKAWDTPASSLNDNPLLNTMRAMSEHRGKPQS